MRESKIERDVDKKICNCIPFKLQKRRGAPDHLYFLPNGVVAMIEFKAPDGKPRSNQAKWIKDLKSLGHHVEVFDNTSKAVDWLVTLGATRV